MRRYAGLVEFTMTRCCAVLWITSAICFAQTRTPSDAWLMQNYRFVHPPPQNTPPVPAVIAQLQEVQMTTLNILRIADFEGDYEAALAAAALAASNAQLLGV